MRVEITDNQVVLRASAGNTYDWANMSGAKWPASTLSGNRFVASFDSNGLVDLSINGRFNNDDNIDGHELSACCADLLADQLPVNHPAYLVAVDQFRN